MKIGLKNVLFFAVVAIHTDTHWFHVYTFMWIDRQADKQADT